MSATPHDSTGTTLTFPGFTGSVTSITYNRTDVNAEEIDISHLGLTTGAAVVTRKRPLVGAPNDTGKTVSIEFIGTGSLAGGATGTLVIGGGLTINAIATVASSSLTLAVNDVIRGSAEFRVA